MLPTRRDSRLQIHTTYDQPASRFLEIDEHRFPDCWQRAGHLFYITTERRVFICTSTCTGGGVFLPLSLYHISFLDCPSLLTTTAYTPGCHAYSFLRMLLSCLRVCEMKRECASSSQSAHQIRYISGFSTSQYQLWDTMSPRYWMNLNFQSAQIHL